MYPFPPSAKVSTQTPTAQATGETDWRGREAEFRTHPWSRVRSSCARYFRVCCCIYREKEAKRKELDKFSKLCSW